MYAETSKNEDTWYRMPGHCDAEYDSARRVIQRAVAQKAIYTILRNPNGNRNVLYLYRLDDGKWNWNYNWLENDWNDDNFSAVRATLFISLLHSSS